MFIMFTPPYDKKITTVFFAVVDRSVKYGGISFAKLQKNSNSKRYFCKFYKTKLLFFRMYLKILPILV